MTGETFLSLWLEIDIATFGTQQSLAHLMRVCNEDIICLW